MEVETPRARQSAAAKELVDAAEEYAGALLRAEKLQGEYGAVQKALTNAVSRYKDARSKLLEAFPEEL